MSFGMEKYCEFELPTAVNISKKKNVGLLLLIYFVEINQIWNIWSVCNVFYVRAFM